MVKTAGCGPADGGSIPPHLTTIVNGKQLPKDWRLDSRYSYIGRPSKWGNPFSVSVYGRERCIKMYEAAIRKRPDLLVKLSELDGQIGVCWCAPLACHGDVLIKLRKEQLGV